MSKKEIGIYIIKKILLFLASIFLLSVIVFYISRLAPGDPLVSYYGERVEKMSPEEHDWAMEKLGLNESVSVQYVKWLSNAFHGEFGISYKYKMDVLEVISGRVGNTMLLGGIGFVLIFTLALLLGILCAWHEEKWLDKIICQVGTVTSCIPEFWFSLVLILFFAYIAKLRCLYDRKREGYCGQDTASHIAGHSCSDGTPMVLRLYDPQYDFRGSAGRLCVAGEIKRADKK